MAVFVTASARVFYVCVLGGVSKYGRELIIHRIRRSSTSNTNSSTITSLPSITTQNSTISNKSEVKNEILNEEKPKSIASFKVNI